MKPPGKTHGHLSRAGAQWLVLFLALAVMGLLFLADFLADFRHHRALAFADMSDRARIIETNVEGKLETVYFVLGNLQAVAANSVNTGRLQDLTPHLNVIRDSLPGVRTLAILDAEGTVRVANRPELVGGNFAHREYFRAPLAKPDAKRLYVSAPFRTVLGVQAINVSRAWLARDGRLGGIVTATLDPAFFLRLLQTARSSDDMYVLLAVGERTAFLSLPDKAGTWLQDLADRGGAFGSPEHERETEGGALPMVDAEGERRVVAVRWGLTESMAPEDRIRVLVSRDMTALDADGYHGVPLKVGLFGSVAFLGVLALSVAQRRKRVYMAERVRQEQVLRDRESFLHRLADNLPGLVSHWDNDLRCAFANHAYREWFGRNPEEMIGMRLQDLLGPALFARSEPYIRAVLRGEPQRFERTLVKADGTTGYTLAQFIPDRDGNTVRGFLALLSDITDVKQAQLALEQANTELAARTRLAEEASAAKTRFLSGVSHELRTPLHTILGYVGLLLKDTEGEVRRRLSIVESSGTQLLKLIDDLLEFNQGTAAGMHPETVALADIASQVEHAGRLLASPGSNRFEVILGDDLPAAVIVDEQRLLQVLLNLIGNACKFTRNGAIALNMACVAHGQPALEDGRCRLRFTVIDNGIGIADEEQAHIFEAFSRGAAAGGRPGLGLGLAIARQWVKAMGGELEVQSTLGQGSRFFFTLDLPTSTATPHMAAALCEAFRDELARAPRTVLVVDDIAENRLLLGDLCERWGFTVREADDGASALSVCAASAIDAVLVDQFMPGMDGWAFLRRVRGMPGREHLPVALVSASGAQRPADFPSAVDFDRVLGKPLDEQALACFLCQHLGLAECRPPGCPQPSPATARVALPADELASFRQMLRLGRALEIDAWAQALATRNPAYGAFATQVQQYCRTADLAALEDLAAAALPLPPKS